MGMGPGPRREITLWSGIYRPVINNMDYTRAGLRRRWAVLPNYVVHLLLTLTSLTSLYTPISQVSLVQHHDILKYLRYRSHGIRIQNFLDHGVRRYPVNERSNSRGQLTEFGQLDLPLGKSVHATQPQPR